MNLVALEIENYRQFHGIHRFEPGEQTMVAIIGRNGAGKTTLFEAIEWCLYAPSSIKKPDILNRIAGGRPRVKVVLEDARTGERFTIERESAARTTTAAIYRGDMTDNPIVQGTKPVTEYVSKTLLGLSHKAFVATFFTRQKELSFFGSETGTERRRQVGRLLGLETIRMAQESIGNRRTARHNEARAKRAIYDEQSEQTDFAAERATLDQRLAEREAVLEAAACEVCEAAMALETARLAVTIEQDRERKHAALSLDATKAQSAIDASQAEIDAAERTLAEIAEAEAECLRLEPVAEREESLLAVVRQHEVERQRHERREDLLRHLHRLDQDEARIRIGLADAQRIVEPDGSLRRIAETPDGNVMQIIATLTDAARKADAQVTKDLVERLVECSRLARETEEARKLAQRYQEAAANLAAQREELLRQGDFEAAIQQHERDRLIQRERAASARSDTQNFRRARESLAGLRERLSRGDFTAGCPTCQRPFEPGETEQYVATLDEQIAQWDSQIAGSEQALAEAEQAATEAETREAEARKQSAELHKLEARIADSAPHIEEATRHVEESSDGLIALLAALERSEPPSEKEIADAREQLERAQRIAAQIPRLRQMAEDAKAIQANRDAIERDLAEVGAVSYDETKHQTDLHAWEEAKTARARLTALRERVGQRESVASARDEARGRAGEAASRLGTIQDQITSLAFQESALRETREQEREAQAALDRANATRHEAESEVRSARKDIEFLEAARKRLENLHDESIRAQREADDLDRMYREFNRFEQYVAQTVTPALSSLTSQLVSAVTDGKYERIEFSDDFGIEVYDGADDHFPLSQFSGGERDVIALSARLALSQLIGGHAQSPLQFVVLDEVFGSLDRDRRQNVMDTLHKLIEETGVFRQLFVISHVDDVQASPAFDEVWRVVETADGFSRLERLSAGSFPEDL
jgi:DNA repair protein SbcC/Rad50